MISKLLNIAIHISIVIMVIAVILTKLSKKETYISVVNGETLPLNDSNIFIHLKNFEIIKYQNGSVKDYISEVEIKKDNTVKNGTITVNNPLKWNNFTIYQDSWQKRAISVNLLATDDKSTYKKINLVHESILKVVYMEYKMFLATSSVIFLLLLAFNLVLKRKERVV